MKKYKITFFNPQTLTKRVIHYIFTWDYYNHCWNVTSITFFGEYTRKYYGEPINLINYAKELTKSGEYCTIKIL